MKQDSAARGQEGGAAWPGGKVGCPTAQPLGVVDPQG
jgi:hypothetical protein